MKTAASLGASKDAVRSHKTSVHFTDNYGVASKKTSLFNSTPVRVASLMSLPPFTSLHISRYPTAVSSLNLFIYLYTSRISISLLPVKCMN